MSLLILTRSFIVCIILLIATVAHSTEIQYLTHPLADFVHFLHAKRILSNLDPTLMKRYTYDYNTLDLGMVRSGSRAEEEFLYRLMQINTMNELEYNIGQYS